MRINEIRLCNIGSYLGANAIPLHSTEERNIVLIGGKNGAGKTTLFDAVRLCLYGCRAYGYQLFTAAYKSQIERMVSDGARLSVDDAGGGANAFIQLDIELEDGHDISRYTLTRSWLIFSSFIEEFAVVKDGNALSADETEDFNNYLFNVIPPELFSLYFFDGEQIAELFLSEESGERLKNAFLTLCGYDNFSIMLQNFQRHIKQKKAIDAAAAYLKAKEDLQASMSKIEKEAALLAERKKELHDTKEQLRELEKDYAKKGGVSIEEWRRKADELKKEEKRRSELNAEIKRLALEEIPYLILRDAINELSVRLAKEESAALDAKTLDYLSAALPAAVAKALSFEHSNSDARNISARIVEELSSLNENSGAVLNLSKAERDSLLAQIRYAQSLQKEKTIKNRIALKESIERSKALREEIEACTIECINHYNVTRNNLLEKMAEAEAQIEEREESLGKLNEEQKALKEAFANANELLEEELLSNSIIDISSKAALLVEELLSTLTKAKVSTVESAFLEELKLLTQKEAFASKIKIDADFNIRAYKKGAAGEEIEADKTRFSKGEKQIFIMALYWALMKIARVNVPFMIDTPFARIDSGHRERIAECFFSKLSGQVIIFSTDEEFVGRPLKAIAGKIGSTLLLENEDNSKTAIKLNEYFEELP